MSFIAHTLNTVFCMYQMKYNKDWDKKLNKLLDKYSDSAVLGTYCVELGSFEVWIANKWYSYGCAMWVEGKGVKKSCQFRPSIFTMRRLDRLVQSLKEKHKQAEKKEAEEQLKKILEIP